MKRTIIIITAILFAVNLLFGLLLSAYKPFNVGFTSLIIIATGTLIYLLQTIKLKDAFAISLAFVYAFLGIVEYILGVTAPAHFQDNGCVIVAIVLFVIEMIITIVCSVTSKRSI